MTSPRKGAHSKWRGHPITWDGSAWRFDDTGEPTETTWKKRPCGKCGKIFQGLNADDFDPCLGMLPGVDNACCGHGNPSEAYIQFTNGVVVKGFTVEQI